MTAPVPSDIDGPAGLRDYWLHYDQTAGKWCVENDPPKVIRAGAEVIHVREVGPAGEAGSISAQDPELILAGIKQFGLAPDGSDLRDLAARLAALQQELGQMTENRDFFMQEAHEQQLRAEATEALAASLQRRVETLTGALLEAKRVLNQTKERLRSNAHKNALGKVRAALTPEQGGKP